MKMEQIECFETSAYNNQTPRLDMKYTSYPAYEDGTDRVFRNFGIQQSDAGEIPKKYIQDSKHCESLKSRLLILLLFFKRPDLCRLPTLQVSNPVWIIHCIWLAKSIPTNVTLCVTLRSMLLHMVRISQTSTQFRTLLACLLPPAYGQVMLHGTRNPLNVA